MWYNMPIRKRKPPAQAVTLELLFSKGTKPAGQKEG